MRDLADARFSVRRDLLEMRDLGDARFGVIRDLTDAGFIVMRD